MENYEKIRVVGRGAFGTVHLCHNLSDKKLVIIKQIPVEQMNRDERQAALNEARVLSMLNHPNIIEYYANFLEDKALMIVMEYAQGGTLFEYLQQKSGTLLEEDEIVRFFAQILLAMQHVHSKQILHRDLKTQNILLDKRREVIKLGDFGISKVLTKSKAISVVGTPCYISPELCEGKPYNQKSDIWALGCILYELTTLKRPFEGQTLPALILKIMKGSFTPPAEHYSDDLKRLILWLLEQDPERRPRIPQVMATPIVINALLYLYTDMGKLPCRRAHRPLVPTPSHGGSPSPKSASSMPGQHQALQKTKSGIKGVDSAGSLQRMRQQQSRGLTCHVYCWGAGAAEPFRLPMPASEDAEVTQVAASRSQKAASTNSGRLLAWEAGTMSAPGLIDQTGTGGSQASYIPRFLEGQSALSVVRVSCGDLFTACVTDRGLLMTFGNGSSGCLGHGNYTDVAQAKIVEALLGYEVTQVSCGMSHIMAVTNEHQIFAWGRSDNGRLGLGTENSTAYNVPQEVKAVPDGFSAINVECAVDATAVLSVTGELFFAGSNRYNLLQASSPSSKRGVTYLFEHAEVAPLNGESIGAIAFGNAHGALLTGNGGCYTFGSNQYGQLGCGSLNKVAVAGLTKVASLVGQRISHIACGDTFTVAVSEDNDIYSWGNGARGRLGHSNKDVSVPSKVNIHTAASRKVVSLACSHGTSLVAIKCE